MECVKINVTPHRFKKIHQVLISILNPKGMKLLKKINTQYTNPGRVKQYHPAEILTTEIFIVTQFSSIWDLRVSLNNVYNYQLTKDTIVWSTAIKIPGYLVSRRFPTNLSGVGECITPVKFQIGTRRPSGPVIFIQV